MGLDLTVEPLQRVVGAVDQQFHHLGVFGTGHMKYVPVIYLVVPQPGLVKVFPEDAPLVFVNIIAQLETIGRGALGQLIFNERYGLGLDILGVHDSEHFHQTVSFHDERHNVCINMELDQISATALLPVKEASNQERQHEQRRVCTQQGLDSVKESLLKVACNGRSLQIAPAASLLNTLKNDEFISFKESIVIKQ